MTYDPWLDAAQRYPEIHIEPVRGDIGPAHAVWVPAERVILIERSLMRAQRRVALTHELAHVDTGDSALDMCWFSSRQEAAADRLAAERLVSVDDLAAVFRWTTDRLEVAAELEVTTAILYVRWRWMRPCERTRCRQAMSQWEAAA